MNQKVTGGGNGLGRAISLELAKHGCHVAIADVDLTGAKRTAADLRNMGVKSHAYQVIPFTCLIKWNRAVVDRKFKII